LKANRDMMRSPAVRPTGPRRLHDRTAAACRQKTNLLAHAFRVGMLHRLLPSSQLNPRGDGATRQGAVRDPGHLRPIRVNRCHIAVSALRRGQLTRRIGGFSIGHRRPLASANRAASRRGMAHWGTVASWTPYQDPASRAGSRI
jgi:hypothetical protein